MRKYKDAALALSLANLCFFKIWAQVLPGAYGHYFMKQPPSVSINLGVIASVLALAAVFWGAVTVARRLPGRWGTELARWGFVLVFIVALNGVRQYLILSAALPFWLAPFGDTTLGTAILALPLAVLLAVRRWRHRLVRVSAAVVVLLAPFALVTCAQAAWSAVKTARHMPFAEFADQPPAASLPAPAEGAPRVLWFLFDGMEQRRSFSHRSPTLQLPAFDRLRSQAISANQAYPPAGNTILTMPALITGRLLANSRPAGASELRLTFADDGTSAGWSTQPTLFSRARALGFNTAVVGYYHPYCRVFGSSLTICSWETDWWHPLGIEDPETSVWRIMRNLAPALLQSVPGVWRVQSSEPPGAGLQLTASVNERREHIRHYLDILEQATAAAANPELSVILVHWPIPHLPAIYDRTTGRLIAEGRSDYLDNLALADRALGEVRRAMETAGIWDRTTLVVTADHWMNRSDTTDHRVIFLLKLAGQREPVIYQPAFNTLLLHDLVLAVLRSEISDPVGAVRWLDANRARVATPVSEASTRMVKARP